MFRRIQTFTKLKRTFQTTQKVFELSKLEQALSTKDPTFLDHLIVSPIQIGLSKSIPLVKDDTFQQEMNPHPVKIPANSNLPIMVLGKDDRFFFPIFTSLQRAHKTFGDVGTIITVRGSELFYMVHRQLFDNVQILINPGSHPSALINKDELEILFEKAEKYVDYQHGILSKTKPTNATPEMLDSFKKVFKGNSKVIAAQLSFIEHVEYGKLYWVELQVDPQISTDELNIIQKCFNEETRKYKISALVSPIPYQIRVSKNAELVYP